MKQLNTLNEKYDELTDHGRGKSNDPKSGKFLDTNTGTAEDAGGKRQGAEGRSTGRCTNSAKPWGARHSTRRSSSSYESEHARIWRRPGTHVGLRNPADSVLGRGRVQIDPIVVIGLQENGKIHLSDTASGSGWSRTTAGVLMDAFLFELAYMPSSLPGFAGMIQGHLDIPPPFAGGINNTIGSDYITAMQAASLAGEPTTFWFFVERPLFDAQGMFLIGNEAVVGSLKFGVAARSRSRAR